MRRSCLFLVLLLSGCGLFGPVSQPVPPAARAGLLAPGDAVRIAVADEPEMSGVFTVAPGGTVHLELLGEVQAAGLTPALLAEDLRRRLAAGYLRQPEVMVMRADLRMPPAAARMAAATPPPPLQGSLAGDDDQDWSRNPVRFIPPIPALRPALDVGRFY